MPEEHDQPLRLLWIALGIATWLVFLACILFGINHMLNH